MKKTQKKTNEKTLEIDLPLEQAIERLFADPKTTQKEETVIRLAVQCGFSKYMIA